MSVQVIVPGVLPPVSHIGVRVVVIDDGKTPWSMTYWLAALYIVFMSLFLCASLALPSCLAGLMATMTIPANMAMMATTRRISRRVKAREEEDGRGVRPFKNLLEERRLKEREFERCMMWLF